MIPSRRLVALAAVPLVPAVAAWFVPGLWAVVVGFDLLLAAVAAVDAVAAARPVVRVGRAVRERQLVARPFDVVLTVDADPRLGVVEVTDDPPLPWLPEPIRVDVSGGVVQLTRTLRLDRRGRHGFGAVAVRTRSPLGLWWRQQSVPADGDGHVRVGPDVTPLRGKAIAGRRDDRRAPVRVRRTVGGDSEFERLRPYVAGDAMRHVDWRATARQRKLVVRQFGQEVGQHVVFLLDSGRLMTQVIGDRTAFDAVLDASLVLAWTALRHGDRVGMMVADRTVRAWVPPRAGMGQGARLLRAVTDVHPTLDEADPAAALAWLSARLGRRSLVVWITRALDEVAEARAEALVRAMSGRHLPLCVWVRDPRLDARILGAPDAPDHDGYRRAAAADLAARRLQALARLRRRGALVVDATPDDLGEALRRRYLDVKARHLL